MISVRISQPEFSRAGKYCLRTLTLTYYFVGYYFPPIGATHYVFKYL
jgi:hypothetical protein